MKMNNQERYDELDNIVSSIDILVDDIRDKYYIDMLNEIKFEAQIEREEVEERLQEEYDRQEKEMNYEYEKGRL